VPVRHLTPHEEGIRDESVAGDRVNLRRKGAGVLLANWIVVPVHLLSGIAVIRFAGAEARGTLIILTTLVAILATLGQFGFPTSGSYYLRQRIYGERTLVVNYLAVVVGVTVLSGALMLTGSDLFDRVFLEGAGDTSALILLAMCGLPMMMFSNFAAALLLAAGRVRAYSFLTVIPAVAGLAMTLMFVAVLDLGVTGALLAIVLSLGVSVLVAALPMLRRTSGQASELTRKTMGDLLRFGLRYYGVTLSFQIFKRGDNFLLAYYLDLTAVAYYSVGVSLYELILTLPRAVSGLVTGETAARAKESAGEFVARASRGVIWVMVAAALVLAPLSYLVIPPIYGEDFTEARAPALILLASGVLFGFTLSLQSYFTGIGRPGFNALLSFPVGALNLVLSVILIPREGIVGNALATLLAAAFSFALFLFWFRRLSRTPLRSTLFPPPFALLHSVKRRLPRLKE